MVQRMDIKHTGIVNGLGRDYVDVSIPRQEACGSCAAKNVCGTDRNGDQQIRVMTLCPEAFVIGEQVEVSMDKVMGIKAVVLAYVIPFVLVLGLLLVLTGIGVSEMVSGLSALGVFIVYYGVLFLFRHKIEKEIIFKIDKA